MRTFTCLLLLLTLIFSPSCATHRSSDLNSVLFVGNSLTYVGNTPAVFTALASANGTRVSADMIVRGGATLTDRVVDGTVARALKERRYTAVVLQERGGDLMCSFGPASCTQSRQSIQTLVALAREAGASTYLLGTYQANPMASHQLVQSESAAATEAGIPYIEVSQKLQVLSAKEPDTGWFAPDGMHPGPKLALLNAMLLHKALLGIFPKPSELDVLSPIYGISSGLTEKLRNASDPPPLASTPGSIHYTSEMQKKLLSSVGGRAGS